MKKILFLFVMSAALLTSCSKDDKPADNEQFDGSMDSVSNFLGEELLAALVDLGFNVNAGNRPPSVEGHFEISPCVLESSNVPGDWPGYTFDDYRIKFSNQDGLKVDYDGKHVNVSQSDVGDGSFISGDGNKFTVYLITATESDTYRADTAIVISGKIENDGIH
ncbi:MAG TPA: hypothetical protein VFF21_00120, partial [Flavobacteriaceae bacterium]|nr:hypothetical protein [Flavobacteriaceae bacterium]